VKGHASLPECRKRSYRKYSAVPCDEVECARITDGGIILTKISAVLNWGWGGFLSFSSH
jgi:hypothetical protein